MDDESQQAKGNSIDAQLADKKLRAEVRNLRALTRKATAEAKNAEAQFRENTGKHSFWERVLSTTQFTIVLALFTLIFQIVQFGYTASETRKADENRQWKEAVRNVSFDGDSKAIVGGALDIETFFKSTTYSGDSRALVAALLPFIKDNDTFDHIFDDLLALDDWPKSNKVAPSIQAYTVAKSVSIAYGKLAPIAAQGHFRKELSTVMMDSMSESSPSVVEAEQREWEIDTITSGLVNFWKKNGARPPTSPSYSGHFETMILRLNGDGQVVLNKLDFSNSFFNDAYLHNVDFTGSNLTKANLTDTDLGSATLTNVILDGALIDGADLDEVNEVSGSSWKEVEWWKAARLSPKLCSWLGKNGETSGPPAPPSQATPCMKDPQPVAASR